MSERFGLRLGIVWPHLGLRLIDREQRALAKVGFLWIGISVGSRCTRGFAVKISHVMVTVTIDDLGC